MPFTHSADGKDVVVNPASYALLAGFYLAATFLATFVTGVLQPDP